MSMNGIKSLFNSTNFFRRTSQTWVATETGDIKGLSPVTCQFESLESRVLMSAAYPQVLSEMIPARLTHAQSAKSKAPVAAAVAPGAPGGLTATPLTFNSVQLNWTAGDGPTDGFVVYRGTDGTHFALLAKITNAATATYTDKSVASFHNYYYEVVGYKGTAASPASAPATASTSLAAVATFAAAATGPGSVQLAWTINEPLAAGYIVLRSTDGTHFSQLAKLPSLKVGTYIDTSVSSNTAYSYEVQAYNGDKTSAVSHAASVITPLKAPTALAATIQDGKIGLTWTANDSAAAGYYLLRSGDGKTFTQLANIMGVGTTSYSDTAILSGHGYTYKVQAYAGSNTSAASTVATISTPLAAPSGLTATALSATSVRMNWTDNDANAAGYYVLRAADGVHFTKIAALTGAAVSTYTDAAAVSGQNYTYEVQAVTAAVVSAASQNATATTPLATPASVSAVATGPTSIKVAWVNIEPQATGYNILRSTNGGDFSQFAQVTSPTTLTFVDSSVSSDASYAYEVQAVSTSNHSSNSPGKSVVTPLVPVSDAAGAINNGVVNLSWTDNDSTAAGYNILRSVNGKAFAALAKVTDGSAAGYADTSVLSGHTYSYEIQAYSGSNTSAVATVAPIIMPLAAPSSLAITAATAANVQLSWTDNDANALGYAVLRSTDGVHFTSIAALTSPTAIAYTDTKITTAASYTYEVEAIAGTIASAASNTVNTTTPLAAPTTLTATVAGSYVNLTWIGKESSATGYNILHSSDGITFTQLAQVAGASASTYADVSVTPGQTCYYQVQAYKDSLLSAVSNTARITTPSGNVTNGVSVTTRFGDELVITAAGTADSISVTESSGILTITGNGQTFTDAAPAGGTFIYSRGGSDSISVDSSVTSALTIDSIDAAPTVITSSGTNVNAWVDSTDTAIGATTVHSVTSFAAGVSKALGASLANPKDAGTTAVHNLSLFGTGPLAADVNQGEVGDCYFLSSLAAFANQDPQVIINSAVDLGDGTYAVQFHSGSSSAYVRVNNSFTVGGFGGYYFAHPGANNTIWAAVFEKAFAYFRTGANTYNSINSGWMGEVYSDLGIPSNNFTPSAFSDNSLFNLLSTDLSNGEAVTIGTQNAPNLVSGHAYTLLSVTNVGGVNRYTVRNPWGVSGDSLENSQGIATLTYAQFVANFVGGTIAMN